MRRTKESFFAMLVSLCPIILLIYDMYQDYIYLQDPNTSTSGIDGLGLTIGLVLLKILMVIFIFPFLGWFLQSKACFVVSFFIHGAMVIYLLDYYSLSGSITLFILITILVMTALAYRSLKIQKP